MPRPSRPSRPTGPPPKGAPVRWGLAGAVGITCAVLLALRSPFAQLPPAWCALIAIGAGWLLMLVCAPWRHLLALNRDRDAIRGLARELRRITEGERNRPLRDLVLDRGDELGDLSRAIHDSLARSLAVRRESRMLQRTMHDTIRRETDRATLRLKRQATTDPLTGLGNRRTLEHILDRLFRADRRRNRKTVAAMLIDIDLFKAVNDTLGHEVGDQCLVFLGDILASTLRQEDRAIRLGGDEFALLMPDVSIDECLAVARRISALFCQMPWPHASVPRPTLSIGIADALAGDPVNRDELFRRADIALYRSKAAGRNAINTFTGSAMVA